MFRYGPGYTATSMHDQPLLRMSLPSIPSFVLSGLLLLC
ncbi:peptidoglycan endopeptidase, partial [Escherichia coli]|nr:peptidoglycan endopeptidase [Escherichia coli]